MDLKAIAEILKTKELPDAVKEKLIIDILADDPKVIPTILQILERERSESTELIKDMNAELSRAHCYIDIKPEGKREQKDRFNRAYLMSEISKFYYKYKHRIGHCFNYNFDKDNQLVLGDGKKKNS